MQWFTPDDRERVDQVLADLAALKVTQLRTGIAWSQYEAPHGADWYDWLLRRLSSQVHLLPCLVDATGPLGADPRRLVPGRMNGYPDFVERVLCDYGSRFDEVELWNPLTGGAWWDHSPGPRQQSLAALISRAAEVLHRAGKRVVLGGIRPDDDTTLRILADHDAMRHVDVVGMQAYPGAYEANWDGWPDAIEQTQAALDEHGSSARIWITQTGYPTAHQAVFRQLESFLSAIEAPAERVYWYAARDLPAPACMDEKAETDEREFHFGLKTATGGHKLLSRIWADHGIAGLHALHRSARRRPQPASRRHTLITGGAGFIGSNLANRLMSAGRQVMIFDSLTRPGVERNLDWLQRRYGDRLIVEIADIRRPLATRRAVQFADQVFDFSAQVAVTTSLTDPLEDFEVNARGTVNLLEAIRATQRRIPLVFTSTNKVYGSLSDVRLRSVGGRYEPVSRSLRTQGVDESRPLDFHSPYGCSKGCADQYVLDYARTLGLAAVVFRMSCIYGPRQFGTEDQGWVAHFLIQALKGRPITLYGDGRQVRDILFVEDLLDAFELAQANMETISGQAFNIGGGPPRTISLLELLDLIEELSGERPVVRCEEWRAADQKYYVSNTSKFQRATGWRPKVSVWEGVQRLYDWLSGLEEPDKATSAAVESAACAAPSLR